MARPWENSFWNGEQFLDLVATYMPPIVPHVETPIIIPIEGVASYVDKTWYHIANGDFVNAVRNLHGGLRDTHRALADLALWNHHLAYWGGDDHAAFLRWLRYANRLGQGG